MRRLTVGSEADAASGVVRRRMPGIDLARALAIVGMFAVHISPSGTGATLAYVLAVPRGRSAILFGLLAGVGVSLLASSRTTSTTQARTTLLWRAAVLLPLGLALQTLDHGVYVILADYALLFALGVLVLRWPDRWLLGLAGASWALGSTGYLYGLIAAPDSFVRESAEFGMPVLDIAHSLILSGPYPLITWAAPFCVGMWLGRRDLGSPAIRVRLVVVGLALALLVPVVSWALSSFTTTAEAGADWSALLDDAPHSQMPLWLLSATGSALGLLGLCLWLADLRPRLVAPFAAAGRLAFTWYVAHVLVLAAQPGLLRTGTFPGTFTAIAVFTAVMAIGSVAWLAMFSRGPLEYALQPPMRARRQRAVTR